MLHHLEGYVALGRRWVEALVDGRVVVLELHHGILAHGHIEVIVAFVQTQRVHTGAIHRSAVARAFVYAVYVYRHEQVALRGIGHIGPLLQGKIPVAVARVFQLYLGMLFGEYGSKALRHIQDYGLFVCEFAYTAVILAAMARIKHQRKGFLIVFYGSTCHYGTRRSGKNQQRTDESAFKHAAKIRKTLLILPFRGCFF